MKSPVPQPVAAPEPNADRSFFDSILPSIKDFTDDQKLEFRSEVLSIFKRMRKSCLSNNVNFPNTSRHASVSNLTYAIPNLTQPQFPRSFTPLSNFSTNFFPEARSPQIPTNSYSSPNLPSLSTNFVPHPQIPTNLYLSPILSSQPFPQTLSARCFTPISPSIDIQLYNDNENIDLFKDA
ncbi:hypothetical protein AVEN_230289-1 [Araneus ventricosus]|uniref:BESS domain-containing protein n=1 Tax=Araneus ventricosus TaxID=182803 RepID=A0A4Y2SHJ5_ARAVE|nr:hypothetical protein AVEN_230289-1 [Araneus ventricosus]